MRNHGSYHHIVQHVLKKHNIDNSNLELAISEILENVLDPRELSKKISDDITEIQNRERRIRNKFK